MVPKDVLTFAHISSLMSSCIPRKDVERKHRALWKLSNLSNALYVVMERKHSKQTTPPAVPALPSITVLK